jgi:hypothetical protein
VNTANLGNFVFAYFLMLDKVLSTFHPHLVRYIIHQMLATTMNMQRLDTSQASLVISINHVSVNVQGMDSIFCEFLTTTVYSGL